MSLSLSPQQRELLKELRTKTDDIEKCIGEEDLAAIRRGIRQGSDETRTNLLVLGAAMNPSAYCAMLDLALERAMADCCSALGRQGVLIGAALKTLEEENDAQLQSEQLIELANLEEEEMKVRAVGLGMTGVKRIAETLKKSLHDWISQMELQMELGEEDEDENNVLHGPYVAASAPGVAAALHLFAHVAAAAAAAPGVSFKEIRARADVKKDAAISGTVQNLLDENVMQRIAELEAAALHLFAQDDNGLYMSAELAGRVAGVMQAVAAELIVQEETEELNMQEGLAMAAGSACITAAAKLPNFVSLAQLTDIVQEAFTSILCACGTIARKKRNALRNRVAVERTVRAKGELGAKGVMVVKKEKASGEEEKFWGKRLKRSKLG